MIKKEGAETSREKSVKSMTKAELEEALINNFTNLQKVLTNLSVRFDELSGKISKLLELFEISAKDFSEKYTGEVSQAGIDNDFLKKLDSLLDQNKTIAKGIMLMEERVRNRNVPPQSFPMNNSRDVFQPVQPKPLPRY